MTSFVARLRRAEALLGARHACPTCGWPKRRRLVMTSSSQPNAAPCPSCGAQALAVPDPYDGAGQWTPHPPPGDLILSGRRPARQRCGNAVGRRDDDRM